jgi:hypothetical protein
LRRTTIYITPQIELATQAEDEFRDVFDNKLNIARYDDASYRSDLTLYDQTDILIMVINSAVKAPIGVYSKFGFVILDEVHCFCSPKWSEIFNMAHTGANLAMSATTDENKYGLDIIYKRHFGEPIYAAKTVALPVADFRGRVDAIRYYGPDDYVEHYYSGEGANRSIDTTAMIAQMIRDPYRNKMILNELMKLWNDKTRNVYIVSERREHLDIIYAMLLGVIGTNNAALIENELATEELAMMRGGMADLARKQAREARFIFTTYGFSSKGLSNQKMNTMIFITPRRNGYIQICGRICRMGPNSAQHIERIYIDIIDGRICLHTQFMTRRMAYEHNGFAIEERHVNYKTITIDS